MTTPHAKTALVIVGMPGSGKSTLASFLRVHEWNIVRFGDCTMLELERKGLPINEANERMAREALRREHGMAAFAKLSLPAIEHALEDAKHVALDGLYSWSEYKHLRMHLEARLLLVSVFTPRRERYARLTHRKERPLTPSEAESRDFAEIENIEKGGPIALSDHTILNCGTIVDMERDLERILQAEGLW